MSFLSFLVLVCLSVCATVCGGKHDIKDGRHSISMGERRPNQYPPDVLLKQDQIEIPGKLGRVQSFGVCYPSNGTTWQGPPGTGKGIIRAFEVRDLVPENNGGYVFVEEGGVDSDHLCLHFKTKESQGYNFDIQIWGFYASPGQRTFHSF